MGIGFTTTDYAASVSAALLYEGDLPGDAEAFQFLCPNEWTFSNEEAFKPVNRLLRATEPPRDETDDDYTIRVRNLFDTCARVVQEVDLSARYGARLFVTFGAPDPNDVIELEEKRFIERVNPPELFEAWCREVGTGIEETLGTR